LQQQVYAAPSEGGQSFNTTPGLQMAPENFRFHLGQGDPMAHHQQ
jgi:hypothetical protein